VPKHDNKYTLIFTGVVTLVCALLLSLADAGLKERRDANIALDMKKNILKAFQLLPAKASQAEALKLYEQVSEVVLDHQGNVVTDVTADKVVPEAQEDLEEAQRRYPLYVLKGADGAVKAYAIPVFGKGLWSTCYGYLALDADANTVLGITYYKHGETPGLGGEIEAKWFQDNFKGKRILDQSGELVSVSVAKGKAADRHPGPELSHYVDGISGATITSNGVTAMLKKDLAKYELYFRTVRKGGNHG
jgi:Na+-transporting NADH:ubiquinone oxidoreductase subunit C